MAAKLPGPAKPESRSPQGTRWIKHEDHDYETYYLPFAPALLSGLALQTLVLIMDGSNVGRHGLALRVSVVYRGRALPLAWVVFQGDTGHCAEQTHVALLEAVHDDLIPADSDVILRTASGKGSNARSRL